MRPVKIRRYGSGTKGVLRGLHGPAGLWLHEPKLAEVYVPFGNYLRFGAGPSETVREVSWRQPANVTVHSSGRRMNRRLHG
jgi:hypothetical protein